MFLFIHILFTCGPWKDLNNETDAAEKIQTEDIAKVCGLHSVNICDGSDSVTFEAVAARKGAMKSEEGALKNVTNADIAQNVATAEVTVLMAENTEEETKDEIAKKVRLKDAAFT